MAAHRMVWHKGLQRCAQLTRKLGLEVGWATPALTERVGQAAVTSSQNSVLEYLKRNHGVSWSVATLRRVIAGLSEGMESHRHDASVAQVLKWLEQAYASRGGRKPVLAVGRDGLMLPIRGEACYREGATATVSVHDRKGRRLSLRIFRHLCTTCVGVYAL